jgi:hypothetical protein
MNILDAWFSNPSSYLRKSVYAVHTIRRVFTNNESVCTTIVTYVVVSTSYAPPY